MTPTTESQREGGSALRVATFLDKGGTGKTTSAAHLGVAAARAGRDVVIIDLAGKQGDVAKHFGLRETVEEADPWPHIGQVFDEEWDDLANKLGREAALEDMVWETDEGVDIIPASESLDGVDNDLGSIPVEERYALFDHFLSEYLEPQYEYDLVVIDLPGLTNNVVMNGLWAARNIVAPIEMGEFEFQQMEVLKEDLSRMEESFGVPMNLAMVLPNKVTGGDRNVKREIMEKLQEEHPNTAAPMVVPESQAVRNAQSEGGTVFSRETSLDTGRRLREAYEANAEELIERLEAHAEAAR